MNRRILFLSSCPEPWGGSEELWAGAARQMAQAGHMIHVCKTRVDPEHPRIVELQESGIRVEDYYRYKMPGSLLYLNRVLPYRFQFLPGDHRRAILIDRLRRMPFDFAVICQGENFDGLSFVEICNQVNLPYVLVCQKASDMHWPGDSFRERMRQDFVNALRVYFVAEHNRALTERQIGQRLTNAEVIRNPFLVDVPSALPWPIEPSGRFHLACVGRLFIAEKGQDMLLQILAQEKWRQRDIDVDFYGKGIHAETLAGLAHMLNLNNVRFCGFTDDITEIWRYHHALVLPSRAEGTPLVLIEAMLCGRTAITTDVGGNREMIDDGETGFVANGMDVAAIDAALERAWNQRYTWEQMGQEAARRIRALIPPSPCDVFAEKLLTVFN